MRAFTIVDASEIDAYDTILGMSSFHDEWRLFDSPMTVTAVSYAGTRIFGVKDGKPYDIMVTASVTKILLEVR